MKRIASVVSGLTLASALIAFGCQDASDTDTEIITSALAGSLGSGGGRGGSGGTFAPTVGSYVRGYSIVAGYAGTGGSPIYTHGAVYRNSVTGTASRVKGTPLGSRLDLPGNLAAASAPWGYTRSDQWEAILYIDTNRHVHEITVSGSVSDDLDYCGSPFFAPLAAPAPVNGQVPDVIGYIRSDGLNAVVYRSELDHVIELTSVGWWTVTDLTAVSGASAVVGKGSAFPYVRSDGWNTVVYVGNDNHIHELAKNGAQWQDGDLSAITGDTVTPGTDPWGYQRSDGWNSVVYTSVDGQMHELAYYPGGAWGSWILPAVVPNSAPNYRPSGYVRGDGVSVVVYVSDRIYVHELSLTGSGWVDANLPTGSAIPEGQVFGHKPPQGRGSVVFRGYVNGAYQGIELSLPSVGSWSNHVF